MLSERKSLTRDERDAVLRESGYRCGAPTGDTTIALDVHHIIHVWKEAVMIHLIFSELIWSYLFSARSKRRR